MNDFKELARDISGQDHKLLAATPYVYHCHHFNLFHDQTVEDALGQEEAAAVRIRAAHDAAAHLLANLAVEVGASTPVERLQLASTVFAWMGQGQLDVLGDSVGGSAIGSPLHYSFAWLEKYGSRVRRHFPIDAFAAGYAAAVMEVAFGLEHGSVGATEKACHVCKEPECQFELTHSNEDLIAPGVPIDGNVITRHAKPPEAGIEEGRIQGIAEGLNGFLRGIDGDQRGLIQGFGIFITRHLPAYYNQTAYESIHYIEQHAPQATTAVEQLFGESGHVCVFNTFGNILLSPEWEGLVGSPSGDVEEIVTSCLAIARGLGFGHWILKELIPGQRLVMRCSSNYEFPFYLERYGRSEKPRCYVFANAARAIMQLAHRVDWPSKPKLTEQLYQDLFKNELQWHVEETQCCCQGEDHCEVVVSRS